MQVALDARTLQDPVLGGIGRTLHHLIPRLAAAVDLVALTDARRPPVDGLPIPQHALRAPGPAKGAIWLQLAVPRFLKGFDGIFHCPFYGLPVRQPVPMVVTLHDVTFEHHPEWFTMANRAAFRSQARWAARTARQVITVSEHEARQIHDAYGVGADRLVVAPNAVDEVFRPQRPPGTLDGRRYVVALGGAPRRGLDRAVGAWQRLRRAYPEIDLVVVGAERPEQQDGMVVAGALDDPAWAAVLAGAAAFCYPTLYEGFGMPALEACASGTPVVCAPVGALPEVLGGAAQWCEDGSVDAVARALAAVIGDDVRASQLRDEGLARAAAAPSWDEIAALYIEAYRSAAARG